MKFHRDLPANLREIILRKDVDVVAIAKSYNLPGHSWCLVPTDTIVTQEGCSWFESIGIELSKKVAIFELKQNFIGTVHVDAPPQKIGFNFVIEGSGEMQWVEPAAPSYTYSWQGAGFDSDNFHQWRKNIDVKILETWTGTDGLVRVDVPHRVVGGPTDRYAITLRPTANWPGTFDDIVKVLNL